jgi:hypothetical protein
MGSIGQAAHAPSHCRAEGAPESLCFRLTDGIIPPSAESKATQENQGRTEEDGHRPGSSKRSWVLYVSLRDYSVEPWAKASHQGAKDAIVQATEQLRGVE